MDNEIEKMKNTICFNKVFTAESAPKRTKIKLGKLIMSNNSKTKTFSFLKNFEVSIITS